MPAASTRFLLRDGDVSLPREGSQLLDERRMHAAARSGATACVLKDEHELLVAGEHLQDQLDAPDGRVLLIRQPHPEPVPRRCLGPGRRAAARLPGGVLELDWDRDSGHIWMTGPAVTVFEGEVD